MNKKRYLYILLIVMVSMISCEKYNAESMKDIIQLDKGWKYKMAEDANWNHAEVPGNIHSDLLRNNIIHEPFYRQNEKDLQWIDKKKWIYKCEFNIDSNLMSREGKYIHFKGLDTYANVKLNGKFLLKTDNMFRSWKHDVKDYIHPGINVLEIEFNSPIEVGLEKLKEYGMPLPAINDQSEVGGLGNTKVSIFSRKAPYHYGWDWGPRFVTTGIWRPVELVFMDNAEIVDVYYKTGEIQDDKAIISCEATFKVLKKGKYKFCIKDKGNKKVLFKSDVVLDTGETTKTIKFNISKPKLWWPNGYGDQCLYALEARLKDNEGRHTLQETKIGIRDIKLVIEPDTLGSSFYFEVNGVPIFAKGANYIPNDNFLTEVTDEKYRHVIKSAADAHMNMLRVWGGGIYENDIFYELCNEYGILVWQDFMFACSMYPGNIKFLDNVTLEAIENIKRIRNHPSLALWCGNNENDIAWCQNIENCGWGWKQRYNMKQREIVWKAYDTLFHNILPTLVKNYDPKTFYWPSSPMAGPGEHASMTNTSGDMHYWGVWHGGHLFEEFEDYPSRFMSEYGFQAFPDMTTIQEFTLPHDWDLYSDVMKSHQRANGGNEKLTTYMKRYYGIPEKFEDFIYVALLQQAYGMNMGINYHRLKKPYCMGTLYWQLNDCWPGASWAGIDYYGKWKALHYAVKEAYKPACIGFDQNKNDLSIYVSNDDLKLKNASVSYKLMDFNGKVISDDTKNIEVLFNEPALAFTVKTGEVGGDIDLSGVVVVADLSVENSVIDRKMHYFVYPGEIKLPVCKVSSSVEGHEDHYVVKLSTDKLAKNVYLSFQDVPGHFSINYFDMLPGEDVSVMFYPQKNSASITKEKLKIKVLNEIEIKKNS